jgi:Uma2 family endonuclease
MATAHAWTRTELDWFPDDGNRYEVLDGSLLVTPLPAGIHQRVAVNLSSALQSYVRARNIGFVVAPGAVVRGVNELQPDVVVILDPTVPIDAPAADFPEPSLVVEILSPSTRSRDLGRKRMTYLAWGIPEYWIVDTDQRQVTVVQNGRADETVTDTLRWQPLSDVPALVLEIPALFR